MNATKQTQELSRINVALLGRDLNKAQIEPLLIHQMGAVRYRDAFFIKRSRGEAWFFEYGVLVSWNLPEDDRMHLCHQLTGVLNDASRQQFSEQYHYQLMEEQEFRIHHDLVTLPSDEPLIRLALSHGFAQSIKLEFFEAEAQSVIQENRYLSKTLAATGKIPLSRRELAKLRGILFETSSDITLHFSLLDTPEFFWDYPELENYYQTLAKYLDLSPRIELLNLKLSTIHELLDVLVAEQHHKHSAFLEWIIIVLIAVDIAVYFTPH